MTVSRMASHLTSRYSARGDMAVAAYWAIRTAGLRLPTRRVIAEMARISEATLSRRFTGQSAEEILVLELVRARRQTYPTGWHRSGWEGWMPESEEDLHDQRVWSACQQLAPASSAVAAAVVDAWAHERQRLARDHPLAEPLVLDALHALITGLTLRRSLDEGLDHATALAALHLVAEAVGLSAA